MEQLCRVVLSATALCVVHEAGATEKRALTIGATVIAASQCRVEAAGPRCSGKAAAPQVAMASATPSSRVEFDGHLVMKVSAAGASLDSRTIAPHFERVVLTIAP
jgi:hypothetical protein